MKKNKLADAIGMANEKYIMEAAPERHDIRKRKFADKKFVSIAIAAAVITATAVSASAITYTYVIKEKNIFQKTAESGGDISNVDTDGDFIYSKIDESETYSEKTDPADSVKVTYDDPKTDIYHKMLNSIDYFNRAELTMETSMLGDEITTVEYMTDIDAGLSYQAVFSGDRVVNEAFGTSENVIFVDNVGKMYMKNYLPIYSRDDTPYIPLSERITMEDGIPCYSYRRNVTNCPYASYCLVPQEITFSYLKDFNRWEIEDSNASYLNRSCVKISGCVEGYISEKHDADSFTMLVDDQTGVLMQFAAYRNGDISRYMNVKKCAFEGDIDIKIFNDEDYVDYTEIWR